MVIRGLLWFVDYLSGVLGKETRKFALRCTVTALLFFWLDHWTGDCVYEERSRVIFAVRNSAKIKPLQQIKINFLKQLGDVSFRRWNNLWEAFSHKFFPFLMEADETEKSEKAKTLFTFSFFPTILIGWIKWGSHEKSCSNYERNYERNWYRITWCQMITHWLNSNVTTNNKDWWDSSTSNHLVSQLYKKDSLRKYNHRNLIRRHPRFQAYSFGDEIRHPQDDALLS